MDLLMSNEGLAKLIVSQGRHCAELRQVAKRLDSLLPARFASVKNKYRQSGMKSSKSEFLALTDAEYMESLEEFLQVTGSAIEARVQYETHMMLFKARQSLRAFRR